MADAERQRAVFAYVTEFLEARTEERGAAVLARVPAELWPAVKVLALAYLRSKDRLVRAEVQRRQSRPPAAPAERPPVPEYVPPIDR